MRHSDPYAFLEENESHVIDIIKKVYVRGAICLPVPICIITFLDKNANFSVLCQGLLCVVVWPLILVGSIFTVMHSRYHRDTINSNDDIVKKKS
jgi:hypothetical protein